MTYEIDGKLHPGHPGKEPPHIHLESVYAWSCPTCTTRNYEESQLLEFPDEDTRREAFLHLGLIDTHEPTPPKEEGELWTSPTSVTCRGCQSEFEARPSSYEAMIDMGELDEEDAD